MPHTSATQSAINISLADVNQPLLFGDNDVLLIDLEQLLSVKTVVTGDNLQIRGNQDALDQSQRMILSEIRRAALGKPYFGATTLQRYLEVSASVTDTKEVDSATEKDAPVTSAQASNAANAANVANVAANVADATNPLKPVEVAAAEGAETVPSRVVFDDDEVLTTRKGVTIRAKSVGQKQYLNAIEDFSIVFGIGPAGTGKTYLAMAKAVQALLRREVSKLILTRPAVEAGERLGFLPGTLSEKIDPYLRPLFDALSEMLEPETVQKLMDLGSIEVAPLAYMRGRTLNDAFIILDEAQNTTPEQLKMFLTRLGFGSKMVITGDITQIDLPGGSSGLLQAERILKNVEDIEFCRLGAEDVVRHRLVADIIEAYEHFGPVR